MNRNARIVLSVTLTISAAAVAVSAWLARSVEAPKLGPRLGLLLAGAAMELATIPGDDEEAEHPFSLASSFHLAAAILLRPAGPRSWPAARPSSVRAFAAAPRSGSCSTPGSRSPPRLARAPPTTL